MSALDLKLNGVTFLPDEPYPFLDQAHGVLAALEDAVGDRDDRGPLNPLLIEAAIRGAKTLIHLAAIGLESMEERTRSSRMAP